MLLQVPIKYSLDSVCSQAQLLQVLVLMTILNMPVALLMTVKECATLMPIAIIFRMTLIMISALYI